MMIASAISVLLLLFIGGIHLYWAFGGQWGGSVSIPTIESSGKPTFRPGKIATIIVAMLLLGAALLLGVQGELIFLIPPFPMVTWGCWVCVGVFGVRTIGDFNYVGLFKKVKTSRFAKYDSFLFTPLCLWLSLNFYLVLQFRGN
jgi:fatty acid desaturase